MKSPSTSLVLTIAIAAAVFAIIVYRTQFIVDWPLTFEGLNNVAQIIALVVGAWWALTQYILKREGSTFLELSVGARVISGTAEVLLVEVTVRLKNIGTSRIDARTKPVNGEFLHDDEWDKCLHAGTLAVRVVPDQHAPLLFDWYRLPPANALVDIADMRRVPDPKQPVDLDQINYLADYMKPPEFREVDFWLEPGEPYELTVPLWLAPGRYALKAHFLGRETAPREEEYWSSTCFFECALPSAPR